MRLSTFFLGFFSFSWAKLAYATESFIYPVGDGSMTGYYNAQGFDNDDGHDGIDLNGKDGGNTDCGDPILASSDGEVVESVCNGSCDLSVWPRKGFGNVVRIKHTTSFGTFYTQYGHLQERLVQIGDYVTQGSLIGYLGTTGFSPYCHLHLSVLNTNIMGYGYYSEGVPSTHLDPVEFLAAHISTIPPDVEATPITRESTLFSVLNPHSGNTDGNTPLSVLGTRDGGLDMWFGTDPDDIVYDDGVPNDAYVQRYTGGSKEGVIIVHPDSGMAVELYGTPYKVWAGESTTYSVTDNCGVSWFLNGYGPHSEFGLPLTGKYYVLENDRWRVDFQRGYMSWDTNTQTMYFNCYSYATPGWTTFTNMGWDDAISAAVVQAYERNGAKTIVGYAFDDNDGGTTLHIWDGEVIQNFANGEAGENAIIVNLDALSESLPLENTASVIRGGFWDYYSSNDGPTYFGSPLGDEMDTVTVNGELMGYDPVCDDNDDGENDLIERESCIVQYCGDYSGYSSMQRFEEVTLCYEYWTVECDPNSDNWVCHYVGSSSVSHEGDLWVYGSTIYWIDGGETHGIGTPEMFEACGFSWDEPYPVTEEVFSELPEGSVLDDPTDCGAVEDGSLVLVNNTVYEYWSEDSSWHGYPTPDVFNACLNDWSSIEEMSRSVFNTIPVGSVVQNSFDCGVTQPGDLLVWNNTVYVVSDTGLKRGVTTAAVFNSCLYNWSDLIYLTSSEGPVASTLTDGVVIYTGGDCGYVQGTLVVWNNTVYYMTGTAKRGVTSAYAMTACGLDWNQLKYLATSDSWIVTNQADGPVITGYGDCP